MNRQGNPVGLKLKTKSQKGLCFFVRCGKTEITKGVEKVLSVNEDKSHQIEIVSIDQLVPENHPLRKIDAAIAWNFIYELVEDKYCANNGRPSIDPVTLIKIPFIQNICME